MIKKSVLKNKIIKIMADNLVVVYFLADGSSLSAKSGSVIGLEDVADKILEVLDKEAEGNK